MANGYPQYQYPISGGDPRGRSQNQGGYYQGQFESDTGPLMD